MVRFNFDQKHISFVILHGVVNVGSDIDLPKIGVN